MKKFTKGFTLIELLIVIALLGALAVGLLAALDPFEQLKKGTDTGVRNTVSEIHGAAIRYYGIKNYMPWCTDADTCTEPAAAGTLMNSTEGTAMLNSIITTGELKTDFIELAGDGVLRKILIYGNNADAKVEVCFEPLAKSFINDPNTKFTPATGLSGCVVDATNSNGCLWCVN